MASKTRHLQRRRFMTLMAAGAVVAPLRVSYGQDARPISDSDPAASKLKYRTDATKAPERKNPQEFCDNCSFYTGKPGSTQGACAALENRLVAAKGWCVSWDSY